MEDNNVTRYTFNGFAFRQNPKSPELFAFVAPAEDLIKICGVARKSEHFLTNYQRALDMDRVNREVAPFFRIVENCSPTAIVLSLHETPVAQIEFEDLTDAEGVSLNLKRLSLTVRDIDSLSDQEVVNYAVRLLDTRLSSETHGTESDDSTAGEDIMANPVADDEVDPDDVGDESGKSDDDEDLGEGEEDEKIELGQSMLQELWRKLKSNDVIPPELLDTLRDMLKPALVIDGQHRLFGAAKVEENIPLLVCSLVKPDWKEQVFQFTVINDKATGIP